MHRPKFLAFVIILVITLPVSCCLTMVLAASAKERGSTSDESSSERPPWKLKGIAFGLPFLATQPACPEYPETPLLADSGPFCREKVVLLSHSGVCSARTSFSFHYTHPGGADFEATALASYEKCLPGAAVAVIGVEAEAVRVLPLSDDQSVSKEMESKARELLKGYVMPSDGVGFTSSRLVKLRDSGVVATANGMALVTFGLRVRNEEMKKQGPSVLFAQNTAVRLNRNCTWGPLFFTVNDKLYRAYTAQEYCDSGQRILYVFDLSHEYPTKVYENGNLSD